MKKPVSKIAACRFCKNTDIISCITIGDQYLSSIFPEKPGYHKTAQAFSLDLVRCKKRKNTCGAVQLAFDYDISDMYVKYPFASATNASMITILEDVAMSALPYVSLKPNDLVLDIGGNDGTLLHFLKGRGLDMLIIDPAENIKPAFTDVTYKYVTDFFTEKAFRKSTSKQAKLIFSIAMFYHLHDPIWFSKEVANCLADDGVWIIQMAYLPAMLQTNMYDNIVHEHVGYYSTRHMQWFMEQAGLEVFDVLLNDVYGGSFRVFVKKKGNARLQSTKRLQENLAQELSWKLYSQSTYTAFMRRIRKTRRDLQKLLRQLKKREKSIWIYGASTKGNTIMQYCGITRDYIDAAADANPFKIGKYIIASDIPITDETIMRKAKPDYLLSLPYSFTNAFMEREKDLVAQGTKFIVPLPQVAVLPKK